MSVTAGRIKKKRNEYGEAVMNRKTIKGNDRITVSIPITNTGMREGAEIVQLYIHDVKSTLPRPVKELKGFCKVQLAPGETKKAVFTICKNDLSFFDDTQHKWIAEPGAFEVLIAASATDIRSKLMFELE